MGNACSLQLPGVIGELGVVLFTLVLQICLVVGVSFFKCFAVAPMYFVAGPPPSTATIASYTMPFTRHSPLSGHASVSPLQFPHCMHHRILTGCRVAYAGIVEFDECGHVGSTAVADLHCAPVEDFVQLCCRLENAW